VKPSTEQPGAPSTDAGPDAMFLAQVGAYGK
jgi:hypothetical protein